MELKQTKDIAIDRLTSSSGELLEITSNITDREQITFVHTCMVGRRLGSRYMAQLGDMMLRMTIGWRGRGRDDIRDIAQSDKGTGSFTETKGGENGSNNGRRREKRDVGVRHRRGPRRRVSAHPALKQ